MSRRRYTLDVTDTADGYCKATEPDGERELYGWGTTDAEALQHYITLLASGSEDTTDE